MNDDIWTVLDAIPKSNEEALAAMTRLIRRLAVIDGMYTEKMLVEKIHQLQQKLDKR
jgi:hypothetical protein